MHFDVGAFCKKAGADFNAFCATCHHPFGTATARPGTSTTFTQDGVWHVAS
jgi:hypothetical protein